MTCDILFFPFSHITGRQKDVLSVFFQEFASLPPEDLEKERPKAEQFIEWAKLHKGNEHNLKLLFKDHPYFTSDTHVSSIKSQIKGGESAIKETETSGRKQREKDRLFLAMAGISDAQHEQIDLELRNLDKNRKDLVMNLRGLDTPLEEIDGEKRTAPQDEGEVMTKERISSWFGCMRAQNRIEPGAESSVFVTTSPAVFDYFETNCSDVVNALDIDKIKVHENNCKEKTQWQVRLNELLADAVGERKRLEKGLPEAEDDCSVFGQIKLGLFSGNLVDSLLNSSGHQLSVCLVNIE